MTKAITTKEGFTLVFKEEKSKINIIELTFRGLLIAGNWMEMTDFIAIFECALKNKLGTKNKYKINDISVFGEMLNGEFLVCIDFNLYEDIVKFNIVETQQIVSKLNKLLHLANKTYIAEEVISWR